MQAQPQRNIKARYQVKPLGKVTVYTNECRMVNEEGSNVPSLQKKQTAIEKTMYMVYFPKGHSIRIDRDELIRMGFNNRPRLVDMDTGETVDFGGDPYDFMGNDDIVAEIDPSIQLLDDDEPQEQEQARAKAAK